jgi:polyhydroxyalkanoate synthase
VSPRPTDQLLSDLKRRIAGTLAGLRRVGDVSVGCSAKRAVWKRHGTTLYRYCPLPYARRTRPAVPILICFALVNRPYVLDLQPERSLVRRLLAAGLDVYLIDWGEPGEVERWLDLDDYIEDYLAGCVQHILEANDIDALHLFGVCQGGTFSLCYTALHPERVARLVTMTTPVDFHTPDNLLAQWIRNVDLDLILRAGNIRAELLNALFLSLMPFRLMHEKYIRLLDRYTEQSELENFVRMEKWIFDAADQPAAALVQFVKRFYQENRLVRGTLELAGRRVDLRRIKQPVLNIYATQDHLVPPSASEVLRDYIGSKDYTSLSFDTGHIGLYVSRRCNEELPARLISWLGKTPGD